MKTKTYIFKMNDKWYQLKSSLTTDIIVSNNNHLFFHYYRNLNYQGYKEQVLTFQRIFQQYYPQILRDLKQIKELSSKVIISHDCRSLKTTYRHYFPTKELNQYVNTVSKLTETFCKLNVNEMANQILKASSLQTTSKLKFLNKKQQRNINFANPNKIIYCLYHFPYSYKVLKSYLIHIKKYLYDNKQRHLFIQHEANDHINHFRLYSISMSDFDKYLLQHSHWQEVDLQQLKNSKKHYIQIHFEKIIGFSDLPTLNINFY